MNAIRMLSRRVSLLRAYLDSLPPSYLSDPSLPLNPSPDAEHPLPLNHTILRSISSTLDRLSILAPPDSQAFALESQQEASDVQLVNLLASITNSVSAAKELGRKSQIVENGKNQGRSRMGGMGGYDGSPSGTSFFDTVVGGVSGSGSAKAFGSDRW
jgi:COP9 signalosome complex subunit 6